MKAIFFVLVFIVMIFLLAGVTRRWLENKLFPQTSMDRGLQHSVATGISYLVIIIGLVIGLQSAGINLSAFAVVAGAVGIGIGFGLQNIANNILSGLIILFERPIQVGDRVEVGAIAGDVVRIHARSTTILTNDNIAVIVPNASFITSTVVNWSHLGDRRVRFHIKVGVAYQSDIKLVKQALLEAAAEHTDILKDPAPSVRFMRFGESSLEFEVRVWTSRLSNRPGQVTSDMNFAIFEKLKKHGIEIPNPQKDVHIRSSVPVELRVENLNELLASEKSPEDEVFKNLK
ncbi:MAG: mechanosensitive ion channel [Acidobacteria bacterium]|nr:mechanosensitive ion channel [Acidobacteriota bacterium]MBI3655547.1 mechanosensitive ion channel [Acidobacteriota bacterium]